MNPYLFLWHCRFKELYKSFKKWPLTPRSQSRKTRITRRNLYKNRKYFNPLLRGEGTCTRIMKKSGGKSRLTVQLKRIQKGKMIPRSKILRGTWLRAVSYCVELRKTMNISAKTKPKKENILTHWSEAQAGSNDEKSWVLKISLDCPFNV